MHIFYMISEANNSPISITKDMAPVASRFMDLTKLDIIKSCWLSFQKGLDKTDTIHLLAACVTDETMAWLRKTCAAKLIVEEVPSIDQHTPPYGQHPYPEFCEIRVNHFIPQYVYMMKIVEQNPNELYYLANDDYLHMPEAIKQIKELYADGYDGFFVPQDYPDCYTDSNRTAELYLTKFGYMRTVNSATPTLLATGKVWLHFKYDILKASVFADDGWTWRAFKIVKALTPMPGWSTHLQNNCVAPYVDWYSLAKQYLAEDKQAGN